MEEKKAIKIISEAIESENDNEHIDFMLPGYAGKRVIAYNSMRADLLLCKNSITKLINEDNDEVVTASLFHTVIILYGKFFTDASSSKSPKLELSDFNEENKYLIDTHEEIMEMRNNFVAHRGNTEHEVGFAYLKLNINDYSRQVKVKQLKRGRPKKESLTDYEKLLDYLIDVCESKFYAAGVKAWKHMLKEYTPDMMAQLKIAGPTEK